MDVLAVQLVCNHLKMCFLIAQITTILKKRMRRKIRRWWVKPHISRENRLICGAHSTIFSFFNLHDHEEFYRFTRMSAPQFIYLHELSRQRLTKNSLREPLSSELKLAAVLNYLAHGGTVVDKSYFLRIDISTMYKIIPEVCTVLYQTRGDMRGVGRGFPCTPKPSARMAIYTSCELSKFFPPMLLTYHIRPYECLLWIRNNATDIEFLIFLFLIFSAWIILCGIVISNGNLPASHHKGYGPSSNEDREQSTPSSTYTTQFNLLIDGAASYTTVAINQWGITLVLLSFLAGGISALVYLLLVRVIPKVWVVIAIVCVVLGIIILASSDIFILSMDWSMFNFIQILNIFKLNLYGIICILTLISVLRVKLEIIAQYIRKTCRALFYFPSAFLFGLFLISLDLLISITTIIAQSTDFHNVSIAISLCSIYLRNFIYYFGVMVYAQLIGTYHEMKNEAAAPKRSLFHAVRTIFKYHMGTAAFAATIILPFVLGIYILCKHTVHYAKTALGSLIEIAWKILLLVAGIADMALVVTSFEGINLFDATKKVFTITSKKSSLSLAVTQIFSFIVAIGTAVSILAAMLIPYFAFSVPIKELISLSVGSMVLLLIPALLLVTTSGIATLLYYIEADEDEKSQERPSHVPFNGVVNY